MPNQAAGNKLQPISEVINTLTKNFTTQAAENRELFRQAAAKAYEAFGDVDRKICQQLLSDQVTIQDVLDSWRQGLQEIRQTLEALRTDEDFQRYLREQLFITKASAHEKANQLATTAAAEFLQQVVIELYPDTVKQAVEKRDTARAFLSQPDIAIEDFYNRYAAFTAAVTAAKEARITIYDSMGSWVERQRALTIIKKERQKTLKQQQARLTTIAQELTQLRQLHNNLLHELLERNWDASELQQLYETYQAERKALPKKEQTSPTKMLQLFDSATASFRDQQVQLASAQAPELGLHGLRERADEVSKLLVRFFDLNDDEKQLLLESAATFQALLQEQAEITRAQQLVAHA